MKAIDEFIEYLNQDCKSQNTFNAYVRDIKAFAKWYAQQFGNDDIENLSFSDIRNYSDYLKNIEKQKITTINRKIKTISKFITFKNLDISIKKLLFKEDKNPTITVIPDTDLFRIRKTIEKSGLIRDLLIWQILISTGIRVQELCDIELDDIHITERNGSSNYSYINIKGKGDKGRKITINRVVANSIQEYLEERKHINDSYLLIGERGALQRGAINKLLKKYSIQSGIGYIVTPHMVRHTAGTILINQNKNPKTVQEILGHSNIQTTFKYYINSSMQDMNEATDSLSKYC